MPILRTEAAMATLKPGELLQVRASDPGITRDLPSWCRIHGHTLLSLDQLAPREWLGMIQKGNDQ
ncbi:MAG: sulfurtransferase TusA family protein [Magnetococcales bacterium]|nr:sulfurtransferase TusA family protein [Magnetococcales bacterium]